MSVLRAGALRTVAVLSAAALATGCSTEGLSFVRDDRVHITAPDENETVAVPFELEWTVEEYTGGFAVFFDRAPMRPGKTVMSLVSEEDPCRNTDTCLDPQRLAQRGIFRTTEPTLLVDFIADRRTNDRSKDRHLVTIVLVDSAGERIGESAFIREFIVERDD